MESATHASRSSQRVSNLFKRIPNPIQLSRSQTASTENIRARYGLHLLEDSPEPLVDLIFVHGPSGSSWTTWTKKGDSVEPWPPWLLDSRALKYPRMHGFGYHQDWNDRRAAVLNVHDHGQQLLREMQDNTHLRSSSTPIVLFGYSTGGWIIKKMYILAKQDPTHYKELCQRIQSMFFFATPHFDADNMQLLNNVLRASTPSSASNPAYGQRHMLKELSAKDLSTVSIQRINDQFSQMYQGLYLVSFHETIKTDLGLGSSIYIVEKEIAVLGLPGERQRCLNANHYESCKFSDINDEDYVKVKTELEFGINVLLRPGFSPYHDRKRNELEILERRLNVQDSYEDDLTDSRKQAARDTCIWLTQSRNFNDWRAGLSFPKRAFWLTGELGTGKSVMAVHTVKHLQSLNQQCSYFAFQQGSDRKSDSHSLLRSFAYQMATTNSHIRHALVSMEKGSDLSFSSESARNIWRRIFQIKIFPLIQGLSHYWIIDALDGCSDSKELIRLLGTLEAHVPLKVFLTSRKTAKLEVLFEQLPHYSEDMSKKDVTGDIRRFLQGNSRHLPAKDSPLEKLINSILSICDGCFLLARLLHQELEDTYSEEQVKEVLKTVPSEMAKYYARILEKLASSRNKELVKAALRWTICAMRPLNTDELREAIRLDIQQNIPQIEDLIKSTCSQLVYIDDHTKKVKPIHESVRDFFFENELASGFEINKGQGHVRIVQTCLKYLNGDEMKVDKQRKRSIIDPKDRSVLSDYICRHFFDHLTRIPSSDDTALKLLDKFLRANVLSWIEVLACKNALVSLTQAVMSFRTYLSRHTKHFASPGEEVDTVYAWAVDLFHLVVGFGSILKSNPRSIYHLIPPLCPSTSRLYQQFGSSPRGLEVVGLSMTQWSNRICCLDFHNDQSTALASHDDRFAIGLKSGTIVLFDSSTCQELKRMHHGELVRQLSFAYVKKFLASASATAVRLFDYSSCNLVWSANILAEPLTMVFDESRSALIAATRTTHVISYALSNGAEIDDKKSFDFGETAHKSIRPQPHSAQISVELGLLAVAYRGRPVILWDLKDNKRLGQCEADYEGRKVDAMVFNPIEENALLAAAFQDGEIVTFDPWNLKKKVGVEAYVQVLATSPDGKFLVAGDKSGVVHIYDFGTLKLMQKISSYKTQIKTLAFASDSLRFFDVRGAQCNIWEPSILAQRHELVEDSSSDRSTESVASSPQILSVRSLDGNMEITALAGHHAAELLFCGRRNGSIAFYDTKSGSKLQDIYRHGNFAIWYLRWIPRSQVLISVDCSSKVIAHKVTLQSGKGIQATLESLLNKQINRQIEAVVPSSDESYLLVVISESIHAFSLRNKGLLETRTVSYQNSTSAKWVNHASDESLLLLLDGHTVRTFQWTDLQELPSAESDQAKHLLRRTDVPYRPTTSMTRPATQSSYTSQSSGVSLAPRSSQSSEASLRKGLELDDILQIRSLTPSSSVSKVPPPDTALPADMRFKIAVRPNGDIADANVLSMLLSMQYSNISIRAIIGALGPRLIYLDYDGWVRSCQATDLARKGTVEPKAQFVIPHSWQSNVGDPVFAITSSQDVAFAMGDEVAIFKRGLQL